MENPARGEVSVAINGKTYTMRPSYASIIKIERALRTRMVPLMNRFQAQDIGVEDVATCLAAFISGNPENGKPPTADEIGEAMVSSGFMAYMQPLAEVFSVIINAGPKETREPGEAGAAAT